MMAGKGRNRFVPDKPGAAMPILEKIAEMLYL